MTEKKLFWSFLQSAADMNVGRYFEYDSDAYKMFQEKLVFLTGKEKKVLEIGSGSGFFTNILLTIFPEIKLTCLEPDPRFAEQLEKRFGERIQIVNEPIETHSIKEAVYNCSISHIVLHNLSDPVLALEQMASVVKKGGHVVAIEPLPTSRNFYPSAEIEDAFEFLWKAQIKKSVIYHDQLKEFTPRNPWNYCYPKAFELSGLRNIHNYGWTSVFTLSDKRHSFEEKKKWIEMRSQLFKSKQQEITKILLDAGEETEKIDQVYKVIFSYFDKISKASEDELSKFHEQEIIHRIIVIGTK